MVDKDKVGGDETSGNETKILLTSFISNKRLIGAGYLTFGTKMALSFLGHAFTQALLIQHFDLKG